MSAGICCRRRRCGASRGFPDSRRTRIFAPLAKSCYTWFRAQIRTGKESSMSRFLSLLAVFPIILLVAARAAAQDQPPGEQPGGSLPNCVYCRLPSGAMCWANYGTPCQPRPGYSQCTYSEAYDNCAGWSLATHLGPDGSPSMSTSPTPVPVTYCALCVVGSYLCWANYGVSCSPPPDPTIPQCSYSQAYYNCLGWAAATQYGPNGPPGIE